MHQEPSLPPTTTLVMVSLAPVPDSNQLLPPKNSHEGHRGRRQLARDSGDNRLRVSAQKQSPLKLTPHVSSVRSRVCQRPASLSQALEEWESHTQEGKHNSSPHTEQHSFKALKARRNGDLHRQVPCSAERLGRLPVTAGSPYKIFQQEELRQVCFQCPCFWLA